MITPTFPRRLLDVVLLSILSNNCFVLDAKLLLGDDEMVRKS